MDRSVEIPFTPFDDREYSSDRSIKEMAK